MFNQPSKAKQLKPIGPLIFTAIHRNINLHRELSQITHLGWIPVVLHEHSMAFLILPIGEPIDQEPEAPWTTTNSTLRPGSKWGVRRDLCPCIFPFLHLEKGCWGMTLPRWMDTKGMASQIDNRKILTLEGISGAQRSDLTSTESHSQWMTGASQEPKSHESYLALGPFAWLC